MSSGFETIETHDHNNHLNKSLGSSKAPGTSTPKTPAPPRSLRRSSTEMGAKNSSSATPVTDNIKRQPDSDSDSDCLIIDMGNESPAKTVPKPEQKSDLKPYLQPEPSPDKPKVMDIDNEGVKSEPKDKFNDVEDAMAAMFAGIEEDATTDKKPQAPEAEEKKPVKKYEGKKRGRKPKKQDPPSRRNSKDVSNGTKGPSKKGKDKEKSVPEQTEQERLLDKFKGPFVRVEGNLDSPRFTNIVNSPLDPLNAQERSQRGLPDFDQRVRVTGFGPAQITSTLSSRYDPKKTDESWVCVFCNQGSHAGGLGDLFGPYLVGAQAVKWSGPAGFQSPVKSKQDLAMKFILGGDKRRKRKRKNSAEKGLFPGQNLDDQVEVWFHEDCICWMPDIKLVGNVLLGLEDAISSSQRALCSKCHGRGSTLGCVKRGCRELAHFFCAKQNHWQIDDNLFQARCSLHSMS